jgi:hypothetical protein
MTAVLISGNTLPRAGTAHLKNGQAFCDGDDPGQGWRGGAMVEGARLFRDRPKRGALKAETYEKDGATRLSLSVVADQVLALRQPRRAKKANP